MLGAADAVERAVAAASEAGWDVADYEDPVAERDEAGWTVRFEGREARPGNHLVVTVDAGSGAVQVWPGR